MLSSLRFVRSTAAGHWFLPADGGSGSVLRVAEGVTAGAVRRIRDLGLPGLLPIGNVVEEQGQVWLRTPQAPGPAVDDVLCDGGLETADAVAVLDGIGRTLVGLHERGLGHGMLDGESILIDRDGMPMLVTVEVDGSERGRDRTEFAGLAWVLSRTWCAEDPSGAALLQHCGDLAESVGLGAALDVLPGPTGDAPHARVAAALRWSTSMAMVPWPRPAPDDRVPDDRVPDDRARHGADT